MRHMDRNVWVLILAGAFGMCVAPMVVFIGGIVGASLAALVVGTALAVISALLGPELADIGKDTLLTEFVGSFCLLAVASLASGVIIYTLGWHALLLLAFPLLLLQLFVIYIWQKSLTL